MTADNSRGVVRWQIPAVDSAGAGSLERGPMTAARLEALHEQAFAEGREQGYARGYAEGRERGAADAQALSESLAGLLRTLSGPLERLDEEVEEMLVSLAIAIARQLVRRELKTAPGEVVAAAREAMAALPIAQRDVRLFLHPDDVPLVRDAMGDGDGGGGARGEAGSWRIVEDPTLTRGGCRVESEASRVDASVENRLAAVIAHVLGGERGDDQPAHT